MNIKKYFVKVAGSVVLSTIKNESQKNGNTGKIYFLEEAGQLVVNGNVYGSDSSEYAALVAAVGKKAEGENAATGLFADVEANSAAITTLNGDANTAGSVAAAIAALKKEIMTGEATDTVAEAYDTLKEIADWISANDSAEDAAGLTHDVAGLKQSVGEKAVAASEGVDAKPATGLYKEIEDAKAANTSALEALDVTDTAVAGKYVSSVSQEDGKITVTRADLPTLSVKTGSEDYVDVNGHEVEIKTTALGDTVGLIKKYKNGDNIKTEEEYEALADKTGYSPVWVKPDGEIDANPGLATASDIATEIAGDEEIIADALTDHESRISANETAIGTANTAAEGETSNATGLYLKIEEAQAAATHNKTTVADGSTAGTLKVDGTDVQITQFDAAGTAKAVQGETTSTVKDLEDKIGVESQAESAEGADDAVIATGIYARLETLESSVDDLWETYVAPQV